MSCRKAAMGDPQPATSSPSNSFPYILPIAAPIGSKRADWHAMGPLVLSNHHFQDTSGMISVIWGLPLTIPEQGTVYRHKVPAAVVSRTQAFEGD